MSKVNARKEKLFTVYGRNSKTILGNMNMLDCMSNNYFLKFVVASVIIHLGLI